MPRRQSIAARSSRPLAIGLLLSSLVANLAAGACVPPDNQPDKPQERPATYAPHTGPRPVVQIALLLDTSGSMEGLIHQARARLWDIVNDFSLCTKNGQKPELQVAVYQYGSSQLPSSEGFLRCVQPLTTDLDLISSRLFELTISGSAEYCGMVMDAAVKQLSWDTTPPSSPIDKLPLRMIVIAGNEEFTQGPVAYEKPAGDARDRGILVNTIYCGNASEGERTGWKSAATIAKSCYNAIDHSAPIPVITTPYDDDMNRLNIKLNETYIPYGSKGVERQLMQTTMDSRNAEISPSAAPARAASKASGFYSNEHWDLVDALNTGKDLASISTTDLPEIMRPMTIQERKAYVQGMLDKRRQVQAEIRGLDAKRRDFIKDHRPSQHHDTLDTALIRCVRDQAKAVGFTYSRD